MARIHLVTFAAAAFAVAAGGCGDCKDEKKIDAWADADGDGYGSGDVIKVCEVESGQASQGDDCNDDDDTVHPNAEELCNGLDDDCNGALDNGLQTVLFYRDEDLDQFGNSDQVALMCDRPPGDDAWARSADDCDDNDPNRYPNAVEVCNEIDDDCDELIDDADENVDPSSFVQWYQDKDMDGYGRDGASTASCQGPPGSADNADDCDDQNVEVNPAAVEVCNAGIDDDCDGYRDDLDTDNLDTSDQIELFADDDNDGFGAPGSSKMCCGPSAEAGCSDNDVDCDDGESLANPSLPETRCDLIDNDCDGKTPDDTDIDLDGFLFCGGDCNDTNPLINADAEELPSDGVDSNCDTMEYCYQDVDMDGSRSTDYVEDVDIPCTTAPHVPENRPLDCDDNDALITLSGDWELDTDGDGFSDGTVALHTCTDPGVGYLLAEDGPTDCDDATGEVYPGNLIDPCNDGVDADCNTLESCSSCEEWQDTDPTAVSGQYQIRPSGPQNEFTVWCDMTTDGGGWTLVGSSIAPFNDAGVGYFADLQSLEPYDQNPAVYNLAGLITGNADVRFACKIAPTDTTMTVDLSFYDVDWYAEIAAAGTDGQSCFSDAALPDPTPSRRNNLTGVTLASTNAYNSGSLIGEDTCNDTRDFTVDYDDAGMNSNEDDGTDWGEDDMITKCGVSNQGGAFFMFVREL